MYIYKKKIRKINLSHIILYRWFGKRRSSRNVCKYITETRKACTLFIIFETAAVLCVYVSAERIPSAFGNIIATLVTAQKIVCLLLRIRKRRCIFIPKFTRFTRRERRKCACLPIDYTTRARYNMFVEMCDSRVGNVTLKKNENKWKNKK